MNSPHDLLKDLLEYIEEQAKQVDPRGFCISASSGFIRRNTDLAGLPGLEFDLRPQGDHIWLRLARLEANLPPAVPALFKGLFKVSNDPFSPHPSIDEVNFTTWIAQQEATPDPELIKIQDPKIRQERIKLKAQTGLQEYLSRWVAWSQGEQPRRKSIAFYGDLFALKHQIEAEETSKPQELIWGIGVSSWQIPFPEAAVRFEYPILTQTVEISIDQINMALEIRPRATATRVELEAFVACSIPGAVDVENSIKEQLQRRKDHPVSPFDVSSYTDVLKLAASNLDAMAAIEKSFQGEKTVHLAVPVS